MIPDWYDWPPPAPGTYAMRNLLRMVGAQHPDRLVLIAPEHLTRPLYENDWRAAGRYYGPIPNDPVKKKPPRRRKTQARES